MYPKLPGGPDIPFSPRTAPMPTPQDLARVLAKHRYGANIAGRSPFPREWSDADIEAAIRITIRDPDPARIIRSGDKIRFERSVEGTLVRVLIRVDPPGPRFWSGYSPW